MQMESGVAHWVWGPKQESIEISIAPADLTSTLVMAGEAARWEAAEGYWLPRPRLRGDDCPAAPTQEPAPQLQAIAEGMAPGLNAAQGAAAPGAELSRDHSRDADVSSC
jgi:hypothetical protein